MLLWRAELVKKEKGKKEKSASKFTATCSKRRDVAHLSLELAYFYTVQLVTKRVQIQMLDDEDDDDDDGWATPEFHHMRGKTSDVNNKSMVRLEDYDRITEAIIWD